MIEHHPRNKAEVQTLLEKALLHMTSEQIQHWMLSFLDNFVSQVAPYLGGWYLSVKIFFL